MSCLVNRKLKIIAMYLPQYHITPENSEFWGEGYTDWEAVKKSKPLFNKHNQPRIPLGNNYYDLSDASNIKWQAELAKEFGIDGFGFYHYWFDADKNLLSKPCELLLKNKDIDINFFLSWDNASWKRTWSNVKIGNDWAPLYEKKTEDGKEILAELIYGGEEEWKNHFYYLLDFFKDERYIKIDNKPIFSILNQDNNQIVLKEMCDYWNYLAKKNGFDGVAFIGKKKNNDINYTEYSFLYEPEWAGWTWKNSIERLELKIKKSIYKGSIQKFSYDRIWHNIIKNAKKNKESNLFYGGFISYDDTPRRGKNGKVVIGASPNKFRKYLYELCKVSCKQNKEFIFLVAWNEWGEGAYLEPDITTQYGYLKAVKSCKEKLKLMR